MIKPCHKASQACSIGLISGEQAGHGIFCNIILTQFDPVHDTIDVSIQHHQGSSFSSIIFTFLGTVVSLMLSLQRFSKHNRCIFCLLSIWSRKEQLLSIQTTFHQRPSCIPTLLARVQNCFYSYIYVERELEIQNLEKSLVGCH